MLVANIVYRILPSKSENPQPGTARRDLEVVRDVPGVRRVNFP